MAPVRSIPLAEDPEIPRCGADAVALPVGVSDSLFPLL
jgi:hypothetical protein